MKQATFSMIAFTEKLCVRQTTISGTRGQLTCTDSRMVRQFDFETEKEILHDTLAEAGECRPLDWQWHCAREDAEVPLCSVS
jgi:hypothetical protein